MSLLTRLSCWHLLLLGKILWLTVVLTPGLSLAANLTVDQSLGNTPFPVTSDITYTNEYIGRPSIGTLNQSGFSNKVTSTLYLGYNSGSSGTYNLSSTGSLSASNEYIGRSGSGAFTQSSGNNTVADPLTLAANAGSSGTYNLQGGNLTASILNLKAGGTFNQTGGSLNASTFNQQGGEVQGSLENRGIFNYNSGTFSGRLLNYGQVNFNNDFTAGNGLANYFTLVIALGRTVTLNGQGLDNQGSMVTPIFQIMLHSASSLLW